jgi:hypothetical protein
MRYFFSKLLFAIFFVFCCFIQPVYAVQKEIPKNTKVIFGKTGMGRDLVYYRIDPYSDTKKNKITKKVLITFEIHGFEDQYKKDGNELVKIGNYIIKYFSENKDKLDSTTLYVVPMANPDGLIDGTTNNGKGRCQISLGIDINRDFNYMFRHFTSSRNHNLTKPFGSPEARALRDLVLKVKPDYVIDFHGWLGITIGNSKLAKIFNSELGLDYAYDFSYKTPGYFSAWASLVSKNALLVEYPKSSIKYSEKFSQLTVKTLSKVFKNN